MVLNRHEAGVDEVRAGRNGEDEVTAGRETGSDWEFKSIYYAECVIE